MKVRDNTSKRLCLHRILFFLLLLFPAQEGELAAAVGTEELLEEVKPLEKEKAERQLHTKEQEANRSSVLIITSDSNRFSSYLAEILKAEGLNDFDVQEVSTISTEVLQGYNMILLGEMSLTTVQVGLLSQRVQEGATMISFRPDVRLAPLLGLTPAGSTLSDKYLLINPSGPGEGLVKETIQFHSTADLYELNGAVSLAKLYSDAHSATIYPAVSSNDVGVNGGKAIAFTYDLARSVIYTRQGNPAWVGQERDNQPGPIRSNDMFYPDWVDLNKVAIPQADEQQRLLANIITRNSRHPMLRFWYMPRGLKAAVVMTGDDHARGGTIARFNRYLELSPDNSPEAVADWRAIRGSSYIFPNTPISNNQASSFEAQGFEIALHLNTQCKSYDETSIENDLTTQLAEMAANFPGVSASTTNRTHCIAFSDWSTQPKAEVSKGIRLDANYYYWPGSWVNDRPGMFTGSGIPMKFSDLDGNTLDIYQLNTQMTDESGQIFPFTIDQLLDKALGQEGYFGMFCANMHTDDDDSDGSEKIIASAMSRGVPVISAKQVLTWMDGRNTSSYHMNQWDGQVLDFSLEVSGGAHKLETMLPAIFNDQRVVGLTKEGIAVNYRTEKIKGVEYIFFSATTGDFLATYGVNEVPAVSITSPMESAEFNTSESVIIKASAVDSDGSISKVEFFQGYTKLGEVSEAPYSFTWENIPTGTFSLTAKATDDKGAVAISAPVMIEASQVCPCNVFSPEERPSGILWSGSPLQLGMKFRSSENGFITGVRFYKQPGNTGVHTGQLYS
uniref:Ig-like domain-containing protein n=1 Tax=Salinimicrobium sp. GXAS 041 TaxID=3400806 RepID=UPI003C752EE2